MKSEGDTSQNYCTSVATFEYNSRIMINLTNLKYTAGRPTS